MIIFPPEFIKIRYPGYFFNRKDEMLYSIKSGTLKQLKYRKAYRQIPAGFRISVGNREIVITRDELINIKSPPIEVITTHYV